jgi:uncharacterized lipoprotein NlpE involved in copper resistance
VKKIIFISVLSLVALSACSKNDTTTAPQTPEKTEQATSTNTTTPSVSTSDSAENALDWAGEYKGVFPCADCEGIKTELELKSDKTYELTEEYQGKGKEHESKVKGTFSFDANQPSVITLDQNADQRKFFIGENFAEARDKETGQALDTKLNYKLIKEQH